MPGKFIRRTLATVFYGGMALLLTLVLVLALMPWWFPWVARPLAALNGVVVDHYERVGYGRFLIEGISWQDAELGVQATVGRLEAPTPLLWLWSGLRGEGARVIVDDVSVRVDIPEDDVVIPGVETDTEGSLSGLVDDLFVWLELARPWVAGVEIARIRLEALEQVAEVPSFTWDGHRGSVLILPGHDLEPISLTFTWDGARSLLLDLESGYAGERMRFRGKLYSENREEATFAGGIFWREAEGTFEADWEVTGWIPVRARLSLPDWELPLDLLGDQDTAGYGAPSMSLYADWEDGRYRVKLDAGARQTDGQAGTLPPLTVRVELDGDMVGARLQALQVEAEWVQARLAAPVSLVFEEWPSLPDADFSMSVDFDRQTLVPVTGRVDLTLTARHRPDGLPLAEIAVQGTDLAAHGVEVSSLEARTELDWPMLEIRQCLASVRDGSRFSLKARADLEKEYLHEANLDLELSPQMAVVLGQEDFTWDALSLKVEAGGPFEALWHRGDMVARSLGAMGKRGDAEVHWEGEDRLFHIIEVSGNMESIQVSLVATADFREEAYQVHVLAAELLAHDVGYLRAQEPFDVILGPGPDAFSVSGVHVIGSGEGRTLLDAEVNWPHSGNIRISSRDLSPVWLPLLINEPLPFPISVRMLELEASWSEGPVSFSMELAAEGDPPEQAALFANAMLQSEGETVTINHFELIQGLEPLARASGVFPVALHPSDPRLLIVDVDAPAAFHLMAQPGATTFWQWVEKQSEVRVESPSLDIDIEGSLSAPLGTLRAGFARLDFSERASLAHLPEMAPAKLRASFTPGLAELRAFELGIAGYPLRATASLPMTAAAWQALVTEGKLPDLAEARGRLDFTDVPLSAFEALLPDVMRARGTVTLTAEINPGLDWRGDLKLRGLETKPLPPIGSVTDLSADFALLGQTLTVTGGRALVGGREVRMAGTVGVANPFDPHFDLKIEGENVPFVRAPGLIVRGSPDMGLRTDERGVTWVEGKVLLKDSFFTIDLTDLAQTNPGDPMGRFPYFSIQDEPLAHWRLNLDVEGDDFMRVRTPVFEGILSADFELRGSLSEPFAFGQATLGRGVVMFPFANFRIQHGRVSITQDDPYRPVIDVTAAGRAYGYDIQMRLEGTPEDPALTFTSTPGLEQSDILLMVTAGRMPVGDDRSSQSRLAGFGLFVGNSILIDLGLVDPLEDRLQVFVGEDVTLTGKDTIRVVYRINETWALVGQYDRFDAYTLDLKWTIYED